MLSPALTRALAHCGTLYVGPLNPQQQSISRSRSMIKKKKEESGVFKMLDVSCTLYAIPLTRNLCAEGAGRWCGGRV